MFKTRVLTGAVLTVILGLIVYFSHIPAVLKILIAFSSVKRIVKIKDYGKLLPGHGGVLDRFDSMLFVTPFTYLFCNVTEFII